MARWPGLSSAEVFLYLLVLYIAFNMLMMPRGHQEYWTALANEAALEEKTRQLEVMSETDALIGLKRLLRLRVRLPI